MREPLARTNRKACLAFVAICALALALPGLASDLEPKRVIHLQGTSNTRDIGGYVTADLRVLRWGQIIRSENLSRLSDRDFQKLEEMGLKTVIDLRTDKESRQAPTVWKGDHPPQIFHFPIGDSHNDWFNAQRRLMNSSRFSEEQALKHMENGYRMFAEEGTRSLQQLMTLVLDESNWPILIHCSAGKDRAGVAVALILEALGVDRETIMQDYLLTNEVSHASEKAKFLAKESRERQRVGRGPSARAWFPIVGVEPEMLEAFYASVEQQYGSVDDYLVELGVDQTARGTLMAALTTEEPQQAASP